MTSPAQPAPTRHSVGALAIIRREEEGRTLYFTQWNLGWRALNLAGGHKGPDESFRDCLIRELGEELDFQPDRDYSLPDAPPFPFAFEAFSEREWELTTYEFQVFQVELIGDASLAKLATNPDNRWVSESEVLAGRTNDGVRISPTVARVVAAMSRDT